MSGADTASSVPSRPTTFDFLVVVCGFALSQFLFEIKSLKVIAAPNAPAIAANYLVPILPQLVRLPEGVILLWPIFLTAQRLLGRKQGITTGEWLWIIAWLATVLLTALAAWQTTASVPEFVREQMPRIFVLGYLILLPSMSALALVLLVLGAIGRWQQPWTHYFALVLLLWPALPAGAILAFGKIPGPAH
jgi:hypothetical protein